MDWRLVPGYEGLYEVSNLGEVRSVDRVVRGPHSSRLIRGRVLSTKPRDVYPEAHLWRDNKKRVIGVHRLVAWAFIGPQAEGIEVRHKDDNPLNPAAANLEYGTRSDNQQDRVERGRHHYASRTHCPAGHEFNEANTYWRSPTSRRCRPCKNRRERDRRKKELNQ